MLTLDPLKRFSIAEIKDNECFRGSIKPEYVFPSPLPLPSLNDPISIENLGDDIVNLLLQIGYTDRQEVETELSSEGHRMAKVFYFMITSHVDVTQLDWSLSVGGLSSDFNHDDDNNELIVSPVETSFRIIGSDPFHRHVHGTPGSSHSGEPMSFAVQLDWALPEQTLVHYEDIHTISCKGHELIEIMASIQATVRKLGMQWFHPDDFQVICRQEEVGLYAIAQCTYDNLELNLYLHLCHGSSESFTVFCRAVEESIKTLSNIST